MTARTVTGNTILITGSAQASQTVTFVKRYATISGTVITQSGSTTATTDASGDFSKSLDCPASGSTSWTLVCPDGSEFDFTLPYGDGDPVAVTTLISAPTVDADAVTLLLDSYVLKSGAVSSVFARTGAVVAAANDYAASEIEDDSVINRLTVAAALDYVSGELTGLDSTKQNSDADLTAIAGLTPANDDIIQRKAGAWTNRTIAQVRTDLAVLPEDASIVTVASGRDLATTDAGKILECSGTFSMTCPNGLDAGFQCTIVNVGSGTITIAAATTLQSDGTQLATQYTGATVYHRGSNVWLAMGRLT